MLQPTSCGPGPPDKILEFNCKVLHEHKLGENCEIKEKSYRKDGSSSNNNNNNISNVTEKECELKDKMAMTNVAADFNRTTAATTTTTTATTNNNNCHTKSIKFYSNETTAADIKTTTTATKIFADEAKVTQPPAAAAAKAAAEAVFTKSATAASPLTLPTSKSSTPPAFAAAAATAPTAPTLAASSSSSFSWWLQRGRCFVATATNASNLYTKRWTYTSYAAKWFLMFLMLFTILAQTPPQVAAEKSKHYYMQSLCKNHFLQQLYRKIDGAVLWSQNERNLDCIITFQTHSILQRFMLRFDMLQLDCNDHLYVYDGAHAVATPKIDISCRQTKQTVSSMLTRTNFVTLKYVTDNWGTDANGFKLVITSVKDPKHTCKDFTCVSNGFCIHPDLLCDGINHCSDNSDESVHNLCQNETSSTVFGMDMTWFVMIVVTILLILSAAIVGITICVCRRQEEANNQHNTAIQLHHTAETNGSSKHLHYTHGGGGTLTREHTQLPPTSGNWHHPAGPYGYHRTQLNYLKMATKVRPIWCLANFVN